MSAILEIFCLKVAKISQKSTKFYGWSKKSSKNEIFLTKFLNGPIREVIMLKVVFDGFWFFLHDQVSQAWHLENLTQFAHIDKFLCHELVSLLNRVERVELIWQVQQVRDEFDSLLSWRSFLVFLDWRWASRSPALQLLFFIYSQL